MVSGCAARASGGSAPTELDAALEIFEKYGAAPWAERARAELRASGAVLRSRPQAGLDLTEAELRVALLAADGLTDREICGQLYLSPKTVEFHLGRVYRKLGVRGRTELLCSAALAGFVTHPLVEPQVTALQASASGQIA